MKSLKRIYSSARAELYTPRVRDVKLGERIDLAREGETLSSWLERSLADFVLLGIKEDIGVQANSGRSGTADVWEPFLEAFLNMQANSFCKAERLAILGTYEPELNKKQPLYEQVSVVDTALQEIILQIVQFNKIPILVGGGHNNAYPLLFGLQAEEKRPLSALNLDAHPDFRACEGRHSGNPFRYAKVASVLHKYALLGYHRAYMPEYIWSDLQRDSNIWACSYEEIAFGEKRFEDVLREAVAFIENEPCGLELDVDSIAGADASARSPAGFSLQQARQYVQYATEKLRPLYFHLCEARAVEEPPYFVGKRLAYLVHDFLCAYPLRL